MGILIGKSQLWCIPWQVTKQMNMCTYTGPHETFTIKAYPTNGMQWKVIIVTLQQGQKYFASVCTLMLWGEDHVIQGIIQWKKSVQMKEHDIFTTGIFKHHTNNSIKNSKYLLLKKECSSHKTFLATSEVEAVVLHWQWLQKWLFSFLFLHNES